MPVERTANENSMFLEIGERTSGQLVFRYLKDHSSIKNSYIKMKADDFDNCSIFCINVIGTWVIVCNIFIRMRYEVFDLKLAVS